MANFSNNPVCIFLRLQHLLIYKNNRRAWRRADIGSETEKMLNTKKGVQGIDKVIIT